MGLYEVQSNLHVLSSDELQPVFMTLPTTLPPLVSYLIRHFILCDTLTDSVVPNKAVRALRGHTLQAQLSNFLII